MFIKAVAAIGERNELGKNNDLLWNLPNDHAFLKEQIQDSWLLSGRISYESALGTELFANREDIIVMTTQEGYSVKRGWVAHSSSAIFQIAKEKKIERLCILGGATIYQLMMDYTQQLVITRVHGIFPEADTYFPEIDWNVWKKHSEINFEKDDLHAYDYSFNIYNRV